MNASCLGHIMSGPPCQPRSHQAREGMLCAPCCPILEEEGVCRRFFVLVIDVGVITAGVGPVRVVTKTLTFFSSHEQESDNLHKGGKRNATEVVKVLEWRRKGRRGRRRK